MSLFRCCKVPQTDLTLKHCIAPYCCTLIHYSICAAVIIVNINSIQWQVPQGSARNSGASFIQPSVNVYTREANSMLIENLLIF